MRRALVMAALGGLAPSSALANECRVFDLDFLPAAGSPAPMMARLQIVAWLEDAAGTYVDTMYITQTTGTFGLGNRPGRFDFNSGPMWPYGRRVMVFPVWAHRHGMLFPEIVFQDGADSNLSHSAEESSNEHYFCLPLRSDDVKWSQADAGTCATSIVGTDKGIPGSRMSPYPPRNDLILEPNKDDPRAGTFAMLNPFDVASHATPPSGLAATVGWTPPAMLPHGDYVVWVEVSREFDLNDTYNETTYPSPTNISFAEWGEPFRGQPSVVYRIPITVAAAPTTGLTLAYAGYGDPDGLDGNLRAPDSTITTGVAGSGSERLGVRVDGGTPYRVRVATHDVPDDGPPAGPGDPLVDVTSSTATVTFAAPGDDGLVGKVRGYEIRFAAGEPITEETFASFPELKVEIPVGEPGASQTFTIDRLLFETTYSVAIRAFDDCQNFGPITVIPFTTTERAVGEVDACFIATAAYGSAMAADVELLRQFRDLALQRTVLGELAVEAYYTFSPALAGVIGESELLRTTVRSVLQPIVTAVRAWLPKRSH